MYVLPETKLAYEPTASHTYIPVRSRTVEDHIRKNIVRIQPAAHDNVHSDASVTYENPNKHLLPDNGVQINQNQSSARAITIQPDPVLQLCSVYNLQGAYKRA